MKSIVPWVCLLAAGSSKIGLAENGVEAYRQGNYFQAAQQLPTTSSDPAVNFALGMMRLYGYGELKNNTMAFRYLEEAAEKGYLSAQQILAAYYLEKNQPKEAFYWYKKASVSDLAAQLYCAAAYHYGYGVSHNEDSARRYYIDAARQGHAIAQFALGENFWQSRNNHDKKMGVIWLSKAADQGNLAASTLLGRIYALGNTVVKKNPEKANSYLQPAIAKNYVPAFLVMGDWAKSQNDFVGAELWYKKADAMKIMPQAQLGLGQLYLDKKNAAHDPKIAFEWVLKAAKNGSYEAQVLIAKLYKDGVGTTANSLAALEWQKKAEKSRGSKDNSQDPAVQMAQWLSNDKSNSLAETPYLKNSIFNAWNNKNALKENIYNSAPQMVMLNREMIYHPQFTMTDPQEIAIDDYFDLLAKDMQTASQAWSFPHYPLDPNVEALLRNDSMVLSHSPEQSLISTNSTFRSPSEPDAVFDYFNENSQGWERQANYQAVLSQLYGQALLGNSDAQFAIGQLYQYGIGVAKNSEQAIIYLQLAASQQDVRAEYNLGLLYLQGQTTPVDYKKGVDWMLDAAYKGEPSAQYVLANLYEKGLQGPEGSLLIAPNHEQAMAMYYLSAANHFAQSEYDLASYLAKKKDDNLSVSVRTQRNQLIKRLYQDAANQGIADAILPLAFYNAMDSDPKKQATAYQQAKQAAQAGNSNAALLVGLMTERGITVPADPVEALYWYQQASSNPISQFIIGTYYSEGKGLNKDKDKARELLQQAANAGFSYALLNLAILQQQSGNPYLIELDKAREQGNSRAGLLLADSYLQEATDAEKMEQARAIYQYFADKGDKDAQLKLAFLYDQGLGGNVDNTQALNWYTLSANQGQPVAQYLLGQFYQLGRVDGIPNYALAKKWYNESAQANFSPATIALGFIHDTAEGAYQLALENYSRAADDAVSLYNQGLLYEYGKGMAVNFNQARVSYEKAAKQGYREAMAQLGGMYLNGSLGGRNVEQAFQWYKRAAELDQPIALYQMGLFSETGIGTKIDFAAAIQYYQHAARIGDEKAKIALARMYQYGLGVEKNLAYASDLYQQLANKNNAYAQYQLGRLYMDGSLGEAKPEQARALLTAASKNGNNEASQLVQRLTAQQATKLSFIEPIPSKKTPSIASQSAELMFLDALNEWNHGDEQGSRAILHKLLGQYPHFVPAQRVYEQVTQKKMMEARL